MSIFSQMTSKCTVKRQNSGFAAAPAWQAAHVYYKDDVITILATLQDNGATVRLSAINFKPTGQAMQGTALRSYLSGSTQPNWTQTGLMEYTSTTGGQYVAVWVATAVADQTLLYREQVGWTTIYTNAPVGLRKQTSRVEDTEIGQAEVSTWRILLPMALEILPNDRVYVGSQEFRIIDLAERRRYVECMAEEVNS